ncbi:sensor histidine kinase [Levilactobacillus bambusae]|uniref:histidine kinase n=1 Tax=Levilactobacillus bambusae TaxID=2024736 RepID=A0A2V1MZA0_9LACO|nr:HAMP domain-containing sensor histidine kinase [Levilactobacillus bambusae]PWF99817.1 sensor histidine kinase [Levilactobacillus bambusae]
MAKPIKSSAALIQRSFTPLLISAVLVVGLLLTGAMLYQAVVLSQAEAYRTLNIMENTQQLPGQFAMATGRASRISQNTYASISRGAAAIESTGLSQFLAHPQFKLPFLNLVWVMNRGLFLAVSTSHNQTHYELWVGVHGVMNQFQLVAAACAVAMVIIMVISLIVVRQLANRLSQPMLDLASAATTVTHTHSTKKLPVPAEPREMHDLAVQFNQLLAELGAELKRERQFVSDAAHELRTPIAAVRGNVNLIKRHGEEHPEVVPESLQFIDEESQRLEHLITNLLDLSRADQRQVQVEPVNLTQLSTDQIARYQPTITQPITLKAPQKAVTVTANADYLTQILLILLDNAHKYSPVDYPIVVQISPTDRSVILTVSDLGPGIPDDQKAAIFDRFYRIDSSHSSKIAGSGLGLAILSQLATLQHITVTVLDNEPNGATMQLTFPIDN